MLIQTINPATEEVLKEYQTMGKEEALAIAKESHQAFQSWKNLPIKQRSKYFLNLAKVLKEKKKQYAELMTKEMGKPITQAISEVEKCAWLAEELTLRAEEWLQEEHLNADGKEHIVTFEPLGVIYIIMPWNFPFWQAYKVALPPLIAGNTVILKHASNVTGCSLAIEETFQEARFPDNVFRSVVIDHETSDALVANDFIAACSLTGSVSAGMKIAEQTGKNVKKVILELGGSDPFIVLEDADIDIAAKGAVLGRTLNAGQICISSKRIIVHKKIAETFTKRFAELMKKLKIGNPLDPATNIGPLATKKAVADMEAFVADALKKGAKVLIGGKKLKTRGYYFEPTILINTTAKMNAVCQEVFGPIAPIIIVESEEEAIKIANDSEFGLSASIWTKNLEKGKNIARRIEAGSIFLNSIAKSHPALPIGGIKKSGFGRELSRYGIKEFVNIKTISVYEHK